jgi:ABC-type branched-subunit amino acid transport system substrate-binding protein
MASRENLSRRGLLLGSTSLLLAGCNGGGNPLASFTPGAQPLTTATAAPSGEAIKIGMLLPLSGGGNTTKLGQDLKQAGELALFEMNRPDIQLLAKDSLGTPNGAQSAAKAAIAEGAELIIGPLFAAEVQTVSTVAAQSRIPVVAFSSDRQVAGNGTYLLSFLPGEDAVRAVSYAAGAGLGSMAALIPATPYGDLVETAFRATAKQLGVKVAVVERYPLDAGAMVGPVQRLRAEIESAAGSKKAIRAVLVPGGQEVLPTLAPMLAYHQIGIASGVQLIGTSGWDYPTVAQEAALQGAWFAAPDPAGWSGFTQRFAKTFGSTPSRVASLGYDAVSLTIATANGPRGQRFATDLLTRPNGFSGVDGLFRLRADGTAERRFAMLGINNGGTTVVDPAPSAFGTAGF